MLPGSEAGEAAAGGVAGALLSSGAGEAFPFESSKRLWADSPVGGEDPGDSARLDDATEDAPVSAWWTAKLVMTTARATTTTPLTTARVRLPSLRRCSPMPTLGIDQ